MTVKTKTKQTPVTLKSADKKTEEAKMALGMRNYILMLAGFILVIAGFIMMTGGGSADPANEFNYEMFSFRRITLSTIFVLGGFVVVAYGIMSKGKKVTKE